MPGAGTRGKEVTPRSVRELVGDVREELGQGRVEEHLFRDLEGLEEQEVALGL